MSDGITYTKVTQAKDLTPEILEAAESIFEGWFAIDPRIDWEDFVDRLDGAPLEDGTQLDMGNDLLSPAIKAIKAHLRKYRCG